MVDLYSRGCGRSIDNFDNGELPGDQGGYSQSGEEPAERINISVLPGRRPMKTISFSSGCGKFGPTTVTFHTDWPPHMDYQPIDTGILLKLLKTDDQSAFRELYRRKWKELYYYCLQKVHVKEAAEELVQNIWVGLWNNRHTVRIENLDHYLKAAVKYQVINYIKSSLLRTQKQTAASRQLRSELPALEADSAVSGGSRACV